MFGLACFLTGALWKEQADGNVKSSSATRWWEQMGGYETMVDVNFGDLQPYMEENKDIIPEYRLKILDFEGGVGSYR